MRAPQFAFMLLLLLALLGGVGSYGYLIDIYKGPGPLAADKAAFIAPGTSTENMADQLHSDGVIMHPVVFMLGARARQWEHGLPLKAGEYLFPAGASIEDVIALLQSGKTYQRHITFAEGLMSVEIVDILNQAEGLTGTIDKIPVEGTLLPETYNYSYGDTRADIVERMQKSMTEFLSGLSSHHVLPVPLKDVQEAVTLASVVERETGLAAERPRVAGVFINRLNKGMPLQSDPTVMYAVTQGKAKLDRPLSRKDLALVSPYNTYTSGGLPPGPIANPGKASLEAVFMPETHEFYYFVADGSGGHAFSKTLKEHDNNVEKWRQIEKDAQ